VSATLLSGCCDADRPQDAEQVLKRWNLEKYDLERVANRNGKISRPVAASYGMVIDHYVRVGRMVEARRLLSQMQWWGCTT
jgi:pentatricopeptide repeat domain-containing protein 1